MNASSRSLSALRRLLSIACLLLALATDGRAQVLSIRVGSTAGTVAQGSFLAVVRSNNVATLSGTNTWPGSARVLVNGVDSIFNVGTSLWTNTISLAPGFNRPLIQAVDAAGSPLFTTNFIVVCDVGSTSVGGGITGSVTWSPAMGVIRMTNDVTIGSNATLTIAPGTVVLVNGVFTLSAGPYATLNVDGTEAQPVGLFPANGTTAWAEINAEGTNSFLNLRHAEVIAAPIQSRNGATTVLEDLFIHDYKTGTLPICGCTSAKSVHVRRCHFRVYHETLWRNTPIFIEDSIFELANNSSSDALDFDGAPPGSYIRRCTFRHGPQSNTDAIDIGPYNNGVVYTGSSNTLIVDNLMYDFPNDKGISIGEGSYGIVVSNCLMYGNDSGVAVKDSPGALPTFPRTAPCTANIINCTIASCDWGFRCYNKSQPGSATDGGQITNSYNNIIWGSRFGVFEILNAGVVTADHSDFVITNWPGTGNFTNDPVFLNPAQRDYRLAASSPALATGRAGAMLGVTFPVGSTMAPSHPHLSSIEHNGNNALVKFWVDSERTYSLLCSTNVSGGPWVKATDAFPHPRPYLLTVTNSTGGDTNRFYRLVSPRMP